MVELYTTGFARAIGVSNYNETHLQEIVDSGMPLPSVNQLPYNPHRYARVHTRTTCLNAAGNTCRLFSCRKADVPMCC